MHPKSRRVSRSGIIGAGAGKKKKPHWKPAYFYNGPNPEPASREERERVPHSATAQDPETIRTQFSRPFSMRCGKQASVPFLVQKVAVESEAGTRLPDTGAAGPTGNESLAGGSGFSSSRSDAVIISRIRKAFGNFTRMRSSSMIASSAVAHVMPKLESMPSVPKKSFEQITFSNPSAAYSPLTDNDFL